MGVSGERPDFILTDEMYGGNGFNIAPRLTFEGREIRTPFAQGSLGGIDVDGDGLADLILADGSSGSLEILPDTDKFYLSGRQFPTTSVSYTHLTLPTTPYV